jgi:hypothetical protein
MSTIVTRAGKGSPLTNNEVDANFNNLNSDKLESTASVSVDSELPLFSSTTGKILKRSAASGIIELISGVVYTITRSNTAGQLLTANGSGAPTWQDPPVTLPSQTSNANKLLTTNGTSASWTDSLIANTLSLGMQSIATAGSTTTFTNTTPYYTIFTGTQGQTVVLPNATTLKVGWKFEIDNDSTQAIVVQANGGGAFWTIAPGCDILATCTNIGSAAGTWEKDYSSAKAASGKSLTISNSMTLAGTDSTTMTFPTTNATIARTDAANTFTGTQTITTVTAPAATNHTTNAPTGQHVIQAINSTTVTDVTSTGVAVTGTLSATGNYVSSATQGALLNTATGGSMVLGGGNTVTDGGNIIVGGSTSGTYGGHILGRIGSTTVTDTTSTGLAVTGTGSFTTVTATNSLGSVVIANGANNQSYFKVVQTQNTAELGLLGSGNTYVSSNNNFPLDTYINGSKVTTVSSTGLAVTGALSASGIVTIGGTSQLTGNAPNFQIYHGTAIQNYIGGTNIANITSTGLAVTGTLSATGSAGNGTTTLNVGAWNCAYSLNTASGNAAYEVNIGNAMQAYFSADATNVYVAAYANKPILFRTNNITVATLDASGNLGLGVTPSAWGSGFKVMDCGTLGFVCSYSTQMQIGLNSYWNGSAYTYKSTNAASYYNQNAGAHTWYNAPSGTAGNPITFTQAMTLDSSGNLGLGVVPSAWSGANRKAIQLPGSNSIEGSNAIGLSLGNNTYYNGTADTYIVGAAANKYEIGTGHTWYTAPSGTAGNPITFTQAMTLDASGYLNVSTAGASTYDQTASARHTIAGSSTATAVGTGTAGLTLVNTDTTTNNLTSLNFAAITGANANYFTSAMIQAVNGARTNAQYPTGNLLFLTSGANIAPIERMRIDSSGNITQSTSVNGLLKLEVSNTNAGATAETDLYVTSNAGSIRLQKTSTATAAGEGGIISAGGVLKITTTDSKNAYIGTNGTERLRVDASGNILNVSTGGLGYGTGSGGTVTQATSKSTAVTLNKTNGQIVMNNAALAATTNVQFSFNNSTVAATDCFVCNITGVGMANGASYRLRALVWAAGLIIFELENVTAGSLSEAVIINFAVIKAVTA